MSAAWSWSRPWTPRAWVSSSRWRSDPEVEKIVFDHHERERPDWVQPENFFLTEDGALTTTLVGILAERELAVSPLEATAFALGIHEDTGSLTFASTTQRDAEAIAWCLRHGARLDELGHFLRPALGEEERELLGELLASARPVQAAGVELLIASARWPRYLEDIALLAHKLVDLTDCDALACLVEMEKRVLGVFRSRVPELDAAKLAALLGGGGHRGAASASARVSLEQAAQTVETGLGLGARAAAASRRGDVEAGALGRARDDRRRGDGGLPALSPVGPARARGRAVCAARSTARIWTRRSGTGSIRRR